VRDREGDALQLRSYHNPHKPHNPYLSVLTSQIPMPILMEMVRYKNIVPLWFTEIPIPILLVFYSDTNIFLRNTLKDKNNRYAKLFYILKMTGHG
jgi:hypothetical protein